MDCIPPWLTSNNHCYKNITTYNHTKLDILDMLYDQFILPKVAWRATEAEQKCDHPCKKMTNLVALTAEIGDVEHLAKNMTLLELRFEKFVRIEKKLVVYTWFTFIIDIGSSLGLWLGLSALGIIDLSIKGFSFVMKKIPFKHLRRM